MSLSHLQQPKIGEKSSKSKFASLNINNLYQGSTAKPTAKSIPQKHGLQSLGKVPTARRAPANLPSVKSENCGNDPTIALVPTGGQGWANKEGEGEVVANIRGGVGVVKKSPSIGKESPLVAPAQDAGKLEVNAGKTTGVKSWSNITSNAVGASSNTDAAASPRKPSFLHQKSPLFGQEFPILRTGEIASGTTGKIATPETVTDAASSNGIPTASKGNTPTTAEIPKDSPEKTAYGPGPILRPQTFGNWTQGGGKPGGGPPVEPPPGSGPVIPPQPHKPVPPGPPTVVVPPRSSPPRVTTSDQTNKYSGIMPAFMDAMGIPPGPPPHFQRTRAQRENRQTAPRGRAGPRGRIGPNREPNDFVSRSIIDSEKLRKMVDDIEDVEDWTHEDDDFDYNKKLQSDDEEETTDHLPVGQSQNRSDPHWADQIPKKPGGVPPVQQITNFYDEFKHKSGVGFGLEEEEKRRAKKSEEVMKNIERARQRREEEENKYRKSGSEENTDRNDRNDRNERPAFRGGRQDDRGFHQGRGHHGRGGRRFDDDQYKENRDNRNFRDEDGGWPNDKHEDDRGRGRNNIGRHFDRREENGSRGLNHSRSYEDQNQYNRGSYDDRRPGESVPDRENRYKPRFDNRNDDHLKDEFNNLKEHNRSYDDNEQPAKHYHHNVPPRFQNRNETNRNYDVPMENQRNAPVENQRSYEPEEKQPFLEEDGHDERRHGERRSGWQDREQAGYRRQESETVVDISGGYRRHDSEGREASGEVPVAYRRHDSEVSAVDSENLPDLQLELPRRPESSRQQRQEDLDLDSRDNGPRLGDWVEDVEECEKPYNREYQTYEDHGDYDRPSRPNSRDSRVSKESRTSKESKGSRNSRDGVSKSSSGKPSEEREQRPLPPHNQIDNDPIDVKKVEKKKPNNLTPDLRGYFRDQPILEKKNLRQAPGPITREKLEAADRREASGMNLTSLSKRDDRKHFSGEVDNKPESFTDALTREDRDESHEDGQKIVGLIDNDLLENISEDEDILDEHEKECQEKSDSHQKTRVVSRGRGEMGGNNTNNRKFVNNTYNPRGGRGDGKVTKGGRGGRGDGRMDRGGGRGGHHSKPHQETDQELDISENNEMVKEEMDQRKGVRPQREKRDDRQLFGQGGQWGFMPRGQPSRRGRGEGRGGRFHTAGRGGRPHDGTPYEGQHEEIGEWGGEEDERKKKQMPPRMQKKKEDSYFKPRAGNVLGSKTDDTGENEDWETASETSLEEREKKKLPGKSENRRDGQQRGRGRLEGRGGWDSRGRGVRSGNATGGSQRGAGGPATPYNREGTPEAPEHATNKRPGIDGIDLNDYVGVAIVDEQLGEENGEFAEMEGSAGEFMQVVNKKGRPPVGVRDDRRPDARPSGTKVVGDRINSQDRMLNDKKVSKSAYDRRQSKLPPRLAKQREVTRAAARGTGGTSPNAIEQNGWPEGEKMGVFQVEDLGTNAWDKPLQATRKEKEIVEGQEPQVRSSPKQHKENGAGAPMQTIIYENSNMKGGRSDKTPTDNRKAEPIQLPLSFGKREESDDLKLDFTFGGDDLSGERNNIPGNVKPMSIPRSLPHLATNQGLPASPSTDDLSAKLANTKKLWDAPGMPVVPENSATSGATSWNDTSSFPSDGSSAFGDGFQEPGAQPGEVQLPGYDKAEAVNTSNVAKVKPQQQQQLPLDGDGRGGGSAMQYSNRMSVPAIPSPPTQLASQLAGLPQAQPWAFLPDATRTSPMYNPYASHLNQSILMPGGHGMGSDLFGSSQGGFRVPNQFQGSQQNTSSVLMTQASLMSSGVKTSNQIGPIGTKAGAGGNGSQFLHSGMGNIPTANSSIYLYDNSGQPMNYVNPNTAAGLQQRNAPNQTAFYQQLAAAQTRSGQPGQMQQAFGTLTGYNSGVPHMSQQQLRANHVAGMPFLKNDMGQPKSPSISESFGSSYASPVGRAAGPPSPKTKLKLAQQQEAAKMNMNNINNLNALAQMQRMGGLGGYSVGGLPNMAGYNPSPIARPQVSHAQVNTTQHQHMNTAKQMEYFHQEVAGGVEEKNYEGKNYEEDELSNLEEAKTSADPASTDPVSDSDNNAQNKSENKAQSEESSDVQ